MTKVEKWQDEGGEWTERNLWVNSALHERQHIRAPAALHELGGEPWPRAGGGGRWLPAGTGAERERHPALPRCPEARHLAVQHPAPRTRPVEYPVRRVRRENHRHPDQPDDRKCRPALERLFGRGEGLSPRPCRLRL